MSSLFDGQTLSFDCPKCGREIKNTVAWFKRHDVKCPHCGQPFNTAPFKREIEKAEKAVADFKRSMGNLKL
jgi:peptide subunit release factor 1 (eRF1)